MANFEIPENSEYTEEIRKFEEEDPGHADLFNAVIEKLLNNEAFLKRLAEAQSNLLGTTDISAIGNGTVTGALNQVNSKLNPAGVGLGNVDNTHDSEKNVATADQVNGTYTNGGGQQPPAYIPSGKTRFNMWNAFKGLANPAGGYMDCILMDNYTGNNVPWVTGIGVTKNSGNPRMFIANGAKGGANWSNQVEVITSGNIGSQNVNYANSAGSASNDGSGRNIVNTYYTKADVNNLLSWKLGATREYKSGNGGSDTFWVPIGNIRELLAIYKTPGGTGESIYLSSSSVGVNVSRKIYDYSSEIGYCRFGLIGGTNQTTSFYYSNGTKNTITLSVYYR